MFISCIRLRLNRVFFVLSHQFVDVFHYVLLLCLASVTLPKSSPGTPDTHFPFRAPQHRLDPHGSTRINRRFAYFHSCFPYVSNSEGFVSPIFAHPPGGSRNPSAFVT